MIHSYTYHYEWHGFLFTHISLQMAWLPLHPHIITSGMASSSPTYHYEWHGFLFTHISLRVAWLPLQPASSIFHKVKLSRKCSIKKKNVHMWIAPWLKHKTLKMKHNYSGSAADKPPKQREETTNSQWMKIPSFWFIPTWYRYENFSFNWLINFSHARWYEHKICIYTLLYKMNKTILFIDIN